MRTNELKCLYYAAILLVMAGCDDGDIGSNMNTYVRDFEQDGIRYSILSEEYKTVEVVRSSEYNSLNDGNIVIPQTVAINGSTYTVTTIGSNAFNDCSALTSVSMPSVTTIGESAFNDCSALTSVDMSEVTTIGDRAFNGCSALTSVSMPEVMTIGDYAFSSCYALTSVSMPEVMTIGDRAFNGCSALASVSMPSVTTIGDNAFSSCYALISVDMPEVMTIGRFAFVNCYALTSASMPSVTTIGGEAFYSCYALTSVDIPASVTMIGNNAFDGCSGLTSVYCHWEQPLECELEFEDEIFMNATLYVPTGTVDAYRSVSPWDKFINIEEKDYSDISATHGSGLSVKVIDSTITIEGTDGTASAPEVEAYSAGGVCVYRGTDSSIGGLGHGIYVVKVGSTVHKVAL